MLLKSIQYTTRRPDKFADQLPRRKWVNTSLLKDANEWYAIGPPFSRLGCLKFRSA